jgi:hypothetical protein
MMWTGLRRPQAKCLLLFYHFNPSINSSKYLVKVSILRYRVILFNVSRFLAQEQKNVHADLTKLIRVFLWIFVAKCQIYGPVRQNYKYNICIWLVSLSCARSGGCRGIIIYSSEFNHLRRSFLVLWLSANKDCTNVTSQFIDSNHLSLLEGHFSERRRNMWPCTI